MPPGSPAAPLGPGDPPAPDARDRTNERRWLLGLLVVTGCSWGRWLATGSLKIDENFPSLPVGLLLFVALMGGLLLLVLGWRGFLERPPARPRRLAFAGLFVAAFMLPMLSNDVFSLFAYASLAARGIDVVIDYLWGRPTELLLEAIAKSFRSGSARATRLVEVGSSAGNTISLPAAALRSVNLTLCGSGLGSVPLEQVIGAIPTFFQMAAAGTLKIAVEPVPLVQEQEAWSRVEKGRRIVFTI